MVMVYYGSVSMGNTVPLTFSKIKLTNDYHYVCYEIYNFVLNEEGKVRKYISLQENKKMCNNHIKNRIKESCFTS